MQALGASLSGCGAVVVVGAVCLALRRCHAPSRLLCWLWLAAGLRFVLPIGVPLAVSLPQGAALNRLLGRFFAAGGAASAQALPELQLDAYPFSGTKLALDAVLGSQPAQESPLWRVLAAAWAAGSVLMLLHALYGALRLRRAVALACKASDGCMGGAGVSAPFTLGLLHPRIYLPDTLAGDARQAVLRHERAHIRRGDTLTKPLYYLILCLHWWNPLAWLAFFQFEAAMEAACDEAALRGATAAQRKIYCESLLAFATGRSPTPMALALGQGSVRGRVLHLLDQRRPNPLQALACALLALAACLACLLHPTLAPAAQAESPLLPAAQRAFAAGETTGEIAGDAAGDAAPEDGAAAALFALPLPLDEYGFISRYYIANEHRGVDIAADAGVPITAPAAGVVRIATYHDSYGNYVVLDHGLDGDGNVLSTLYAHMGAVAVQEGQAVAAGDQLGTVGNTGMSTGNHLHLETFLNGVLCDPQEFFPALQPPTA